jgi:hypothetical protein
MKSIAQVLHVSFTPLVAVKGIRYNNDNGMYHAKDTL